MSNSIENKCLIRGEKIILRNPVEDDIPYFLKWWDEPEGNYFDGGEESGPSGDAIGKMCDNIRRGLKKWFIIENSDGIPVGYTLYRQRESEKQRVFIANRLGKDHWNKGYGTDAVKTLMKWLFRNLPVEAIRLSVLDYNKRAIHVYEKCGFSPVETIQEGELKWIIMDAPRPD